MTRRRPLLVALALLAAAGFAWLGAWQVERRAWKHELIARVAERVAAAPAPLPTDWSDPDAIEYRRVRVTGRFRHDRETFVQALTERGAGFWVITPLQTAQGWLLVNRGFVPPERRRPVTRQAAQLPGAVTITGLLRLSEPGGGFLRRNNPANDRWYSRDVGAIAAVRDVAPVLPFFLDADATPNSGGLPVGGLTVIRFADNHLAYALTWFTLAAMSIAAAVLLLRQRR
ncbi:surfeit locus 1 family protein [Sphingomonas guangdongensis]|uniref:SURF1-like protein n=1 Tax=Sphingomonas guangdongensis TaxID=1141890 RepID=A0A285QG76_9SPHN|nr:SURF1 family protein [Sphingomonas guangdongensis]SOB80940.1 surfeit locus 1 family protein [Sphingomonas guangdongensis]